MRQSDPRPRGLKNEFADRQLVEANRIQVHHLIRFQSGAAGRRRPLLAGTRLYVHQVIATLRASEGDTEEAAEYLGIAPQQVRAALAYYMEFREEVDEEAAVAEGVERTEPAEWEW